MAAAAAAWLDGVLWPLHYFITHNNGGGANLSKWTNYEHATSERFDFNGKNTYTHTKPVHVGPAPPTTP